MVAFLTQSGEFLFTSESVSEGHPDKICDQISDAILDAYLAKDPEARVAAETLATTNRVVVAGEVRGPADILPQVENIVRETVKDIGYEQEGFHWQNLKVEVLLHAQSADIAQGVDSNASKDEGAGDQGIMFGYACKETPVYMPATIYYAHRVLQRLSEARRNKEVEGLEPDAKAQVTLRYRNGKPLGADAVLVSTQHREGLSQGDVRAIVRPLVEEVLPKGWMCGDDRFFVNPTGKFVIGGPDGDCGLTGRKIIIDTYGGAAPHGGGAFSGKDPTKVDRSAAYMARYLAKNIVAAGLAEECLIQLAYAIGVAEPVGFYVNSFGTGNVDSAKLAKVLREMVRLTPRGIRTHLGLNRPIYRKTAAYGHFGRDSGADGSFSWEKLDLVDGLKRAFSA